MPTEQSNPMLAPALSPASMDAYSDTPTAELLTELACRIHLDGLNLMRCQANRFPSPGDDYFHEHLQGILESIALFDQAPSSDAMAANMILGVTLKHLGDMSELLHQVHCADPAVKATVQATCDRLNTLRYGSPDPGPCPCENCSCEAPAQ